MSKIIEYVFKSPGNKPFIYQVEPLANKYQVHDRIRLIGIIEKKSDRWVQIGGWQMMDVMVEELGNLIEKNYND